MSHLFDVQNVSKVYRGGVFWQREATLALDHASFSLQGERPTITGIVGESGSGKTTLAMMLLGYIHPTTGQVLFRGKNLATMSRQERFEFRRAVQPIFQDPFAAFNPFYRIDHVLTTPIARFGLADSRQAARKRMDEALELVGLRPAETLGRFPHQLSGGQRQRLMVARAMLCRPELIVADEPVSMVDASLRATILAGLQTLNRELGISIVYITHDLTTAYQVCDNVMVLYAGSIVEAGRAEQVIRQPQHPYTQLLISSIPLMDRTQRWAEDEGEEPVVTNGRENRGCKFAPRCRFVEERCWHSPPTLYRVGAHQAAACVLHEQQGAVDVAELTHLLG
jgi:peptide/nickel transport system ATP-binding protein